MSGLSIAVNVTGLEAVARRIGRLGLFDRALVLENAGALVESQTRRRISDEKTAPDGSAWKANAEGNPILVRSGHLLASIHHKTGGDEVRIGSGLVYSAIHQFGGTITPKKAKALFFTVGGKNVAAQKVTIPARPYLGFSEENKHEIERELTTYIGVLLRG